MATEEEIDAIARSLSNMAGTMGNISKKFAADEKGLRNATRTLEGDVKSFGQNTKRMNQTINDNTDTYKRNTQSADNFSRSLERAASAIPAGFLINEVIRYGNETIKTYKDLSNFGQTFNGSMLNMSVAAGAAGLPLHEFGKAMKDNAPVIARMGQGFFEVNQSVRRATEGMGLYGLTLEQLHEFSGSYLEQQRLIGNVDRMNRQRQAKSIADLTESVTVMSTITGKARDAIMQEAQASLRNGAVVAMMATNSERGLHTLNDSITKVTSALSAQLGAAGKMLGEGLAQTIALGGAQFTTQAETFLTAGFSEGVLLLQQASEKIARGVNPDVVQMELVNGMKAAADNPATREALLNQARAGNQAAIQVLEATQNMKTMTREEMNRAREQAKRQDMLTGLFSAFESIFSDLRGKFIEGFLKPFGDGLGDTDFKNTLENLKKTFGGLGVMFAEMGEVWGTTIKDLLTGDNLKNFVRGVGEATKSIIDFSRIVFSKENISTAMSLMKVIAELSLIIGGFTMTVLVPVLKTVVTVFKGMHSAIEGTLQFFGADGKFAKGVAGALTGGALVALLLGIKKAITGGTGTPRMNVRAGVVNILGGGMGGIAGDLMGGGHGGGRRGRGGVRPTARGRARAAGRLARARGAGRVGAAMGMAGGLLGGASRAAGRGASSLGAKGAAKAGGKTLLKKIPGVGLLAGLGFGGMRAMSGDWTGAGLEVASGLASLVPGIGTAASLGIDGILMGRDMGIGGGPKGTNTNGARPRSPNPWGRRLGVAALGGVAGVGGYLGAQAIGNIMSPRQQKIDPSAQADQIRRSQPETTSSDKALQDLLTEIKKLNLSTDEERQIATAQLDQLKRSVAQQRGVENAIRSGQV